MVMVMIVVEKRREEKRRMIIESELKSKRASPGTKTKTGDGEESPGASLGKARPFLYLSSWVAS